MLWFILLLLFVCAANPIVARLRGHNGTLSLLIAVPLSQDGQEELDPGFFHLAAARLAVDHFNSRNASIIRDMDRYTHNCTIKFHEEQLRAVDTGVNSHAAMESVIEQLMHGGSPPPDAIAGPFNEIPALELSVLATGLKSPLVAHKSLDYDLLLPKRNPFFSHVNADSYSNMQFVGTYLQHMKRTNYIAVLYCSNLSNLQNAAVLRKVLEEKGFDQVLMFSYTPNYMIQADEYREFWEQQSDIQTAVAQVKESGFRTIVLLANILHADAVELGPAVAKAGLDQGKHFWVIREGSTSPNSQQMQVFLQSAINKHNASFLQGSPHLLAYDGYDLNHVDFQVYLEQLDAAFYQRVLELMPDVSVLNATEILLEVVNDSHPLQTLRTKLSSEMIPGAGFMYDAVMSIGLGACLSTTTNDGSRNGTSTTIMDGEEHLKAIRSLIFSGTTGLIQFNNNNGLNPGSRIGETVPFSVSTLCPTGERDGLAVTYVESIDPTRGKWVDGDKGKMCFLNGSDSPPALLRDEPNQHYIAVAARAFGLTLFAISLIIVGISFIWIVNNRHHAILVAAQPPFLYALCFASGILSFNILLAAFDESWGFDQTTLDRSCVAFVWLNELGRTGTYIVIFNKLWRANQYLRYNQNTFALWRALWPGTGVIIITLIFLIIFTVKAEFGWWRIEIDEVTGESVGACTSQSASLFYLIPALFVLKLATVTATGVMAWRTIGLDDMYSDSKWVLAFMLTQTLVLLVSYPIVIILNESNPSGRYIGLSILTFCFPAASSGLMVLPKALSVRKMHLKGRNDTDASRLSTEVAEQTADHQGRLSDLPTPRPTPTGPEIQRVTFE
ncbi:expressed unknown protein [Seminavis robusta]|uniref:G-protein coupled receptors family 3 profile domain-containing protein n=1 Tax=Seminavis robusta TaxID=568900 RepID=A0A9N8DNR8_9STRA|nr:expressed unknown protein [Seminavis robusta]|eukprot:Sro181_g078970.1 n/a (840) ;mRNA; r:10537-13322